VRFASRIQETDKDDGVRGARFRAAHDWLGSSIPITPSTTWGTVTGDGMRWPRFWV
jgi:hypothetical protein